MNKKSSKNITGAIICLIGLLCVSATPLAAPGQGAPIDVSGTTTFIPANTIKPGACAFDVLWTYINGKAKLIQFSDTRFIVTSPALETEVKNLSNSNTVDLSVTGAFHVTVKDNGDIVYIVTGRNLLGDPEAGMVLAIGTFSFIFDSKGNLKQPLIGQGTLTNVCELIS